MNDNPLDVSRHMSTDQINNSIMRQILNCPTVKYETYFPTMDQELTHKRLKRAYLQAKYNLLHFEVENEITEGFLDDQ